MQKIIRNVVISTLFLIPLFAVFPTPFWPLNFPDGMFFPFITGKAFFFRILVEIAFAGWVILAFLDPRYRPRWTPITITISVFTVVTLVADLLGVNPIRSLMSNFERMEGWLVIAHLWAFCIAIIHTFGAEDNWKRIWHRWFNTSLGVACFVAIYAIVQSLGWAEIHQGSVRLDASLGNASYLAVYMLMHIGIAMYLFFVARAKAIANSGFLQWLYPVLAVIFAVIVVETQTRGALIGLGIGLIAACASFALFTSGVNYRKVLVILSYPFIVALYALFVIILDLFTLSLWWLAIIALAYFAALIWYVFSDRNRIQSPSVRTGQWISVSIIALCFVVGGAFYMIKDSSFVRNNSSLNRIASISISDTKTQARAYIWPMAIKGFADRPILGWGQENFNYLFNTHYNPEMWRQEQWFDRAHSVYLDWLVASGVVGLVVYLALYVLLIMAVWKSSLSISEKSVLTGLVVGYGIHNIFVFDNLSSYLLFFALIGFAATFRLRAADSTVERKVFSLDAVEYVVFPITIIALVAGLYFLNIRPIQANTRLITALQSCGTRDALPDPNLFTRAISLSATANQEIREQAVSCAGSIVRGQYPGPTKQAFYDLALNQIKGQIADAPRDARMYVIGGTFLNAMGQTGEALPVLEKAYELSPGKQTVAIQLANVYINTRRYDEAASVLKKAYEADTTHREVWQEYIISLVAAGRDAEARAVASSYTEMFENDRVARAYAVSKQYDKAIAMLKRLIAKDGKSISLRMQLAETYVVANMKWAAIETVRSIGADYPEYKVQVEQVIKQIEESKPQ